MPSNYHKYNNIIISRNKIEKNKNKNKKAKTDMTAMSSDGHSNNSGTINVVLVSLLQTSNSYFAIGETHFSPVLHYRNFRLNSPYISSKIWRRVIILWTCFQIDAFTINIPIIQKPVNLSVIRQKGESQNGCFKKTKPPRKTFLTP